MKAIFTPHARKYSLKGWSATALISFTFMLPVLSQDTSDQKIPIDTTYYYYQYDTARGTFPYQPLHDKSLGGKPQGTQPSGKWGHGYSVSYPYLLWPDRNKM